MGAQFCTDRGKYNPEAKPDAISEQPLMVDEGCGKCSQDGSLPIDAEPQAIDVPSNNGILISMDRSGTCRVRVVADLHLNKIHPYVHVPASMERLVELGGGGSGVTIIRGEDAEFGDVVLKHGGYKDSEEHFALATVDEELKFRGRALDAATEAADMAARTPNFEFMYISRKHLWDRAAHHWGHLRDAVLNVGSSKVAALRNIVEAASIKHKHRVDGIRVCSSPFQEIHDTKLTEPVKEVADQLEICLDVEGLDAQKSMQGSKLGKGYTFLEQFYSALGAIQKRHFWKFTLAQKAIGGSSPTTASAVLAAGRLDGKVLDTLIDEMIRVMQTLRKLTFPEEAQGVEAIQAELAAIGSSNGLGQPVTAADVSHAADAYVGFAIRKNFHPETGRFKKLRDIGIKFRSNEFHFTGTEAELGRVLGILLSRGARQEEVFETLDAPAGPTALDAFSEQSAWRCVLEHAVSLKNPSASARVWTCGLMDCGLHNMFLDEDHVWLFDLGKPGLVTLPAFLTKFLMSFFHTLGMEEDSSGSWVNRFQPGECLRLTPETETLLPIVRKAFMVTLKRLVMEVFGGEVAVRDLLLKYVILQLISDAAFCFEKWQSKGGGSKEQAGNGRRVLHKWLWRALWDLYIASDVSNRDWSADMTS